MLAPDVRGKVTVQTAGRIPQEDVLGVLLAIYCRIKDPAFFKKQTLTRATPTLVPDE